jgi:hypothetical protein
MTLMSHAPTSPGPARERIRVCVAGTCRELDGPSARFGRLGFVSGADGWHLFDEGLTGGMFCDGQAVRHVLFDHELGDLSAQHGIAVEVMAGPRRAPASWLPEGIDGSDHEVLLRLVPDLLECDVVVCGPAGWSAAVRRALDAAGVARRDVHTEEFGW